MPSPFHAPIIDPWSFMDYKPAFWTTEAPWVAKGWVGDEHTRRLQAYIMLESYYRNAGRIWLGHETEEADKRNRREYGDPFLLVQQILSSLLGNEQTIFVEGITDEENAPGDATAQTEALNSWAEKERLLHKIYETERSAIKLGDGVYVLGWSEKLKRPRLRVYDPGFYFPVLDPENDEDYPLKVHVAYEYETTTFVKLEKVKEKFVRRITWELIPTAPVQHPWNDGPSDVTCQYTDATWKLENVKGEVQDFALDHTSDFTQTDLGIDFLPVIHVPNSVAEQDHYGVSSLASCLQILDDLQTADTDLNAASATTGSPPISIGDATMTRDDDGKIKSYGPGTVFETGDGKMDVLDTSRSLDALLKYCDHLMDRMSVNARVPETLLGRVDPSKVPSGIVLTLSFQPHSSMIREMRLVRKDKYALLLKFVARFMMKNKDLSTVLPVEMKFGSYLPSDKQEVVAIVVNALTGHAISLETGLRMFLEAGIPIEDIKTEMQKIIENDFKSADELLTATGDAQAVRDRLNLGPAPDLMAGNPGTPPANPTGEPPSPTNTPPGTFIQ